MVGQICHLPTRIVVDADDGNVCVRCGSGVEQSRLGVEVVPHRRMEVQVVAGQIREAADGEVHAVDTAEAQRVAGHLHHNGVDALFDHHRQQRLEVGRLRRRQRTGLIAAVDPHTDRADQAGHPACRSQSRLDQIRGGGLARGSGDADDAKLLRRSSVDRGGQLAEHRARGSDGSAQAHRRRGRSAPPPRRRSGQRPHRWTLRRRQSRLRAPRPLAAPRRGRPPGHPDHAR